MPRFRLLLSQCLPFRFLSSHFLPILQFEKEKKNVQGFSLWDILLLKPMAGILEEVMIRYAYRRDSQI